MTRWKILMQLFNYPTHFVLFIVNNFWIALPDDSAEWRDC